MTMHVSDLTPVETSPIHTRFRRIGTSIPAPACVEEIRRLRNVEPLSMAGMPPIVWDSAEGFLVRDPCGNQWIDLSSGIVVANTGHAHPKIIEAIQRQLDARLLFSYAFATKIRRQLIERLVQVAPEGLGKAILFSSGTEAVECAVTLMRQHGRNINPKKLGILSIESSYHGRTLGAKLLGGVPGLVDGIDRQHLSHQQLPIPGSPDSQGFHEDLAARNINPSHVAGIIIESIPGWSTTALPDEYIKRLMAWSHKHEVLVAADEIQSGIGRTGRMFAFEHYGITPDLITCGKGLSSSVPLSAVIARQEILDLADPGDMSSTFGGNPVSAAAALACLDVMEEERLIQRSAELGEELGGLLQVIAERHQRYVGTCNGRGLFYSLHLKDPRTGVPLTEIGDRIVMACIRRGVLMFLTGRGFFKIVPPLTIDREALLEAVDVIASVMDDVLSELS